MTKKIGKIIMITTIVLFIVGVVGALIYNIGEFAKEAKEIEEWYEEAKYELSLYTEYDGSDELHDEYQKQYKKLISKRFTELLIELVSTYVGCILLCGYGRLVQDNHERTQAAKELNFILKNKLGENAEGIYDSSKEE